MTQRRLTTKQVVMACAKAEAHTDLIRKAPVSRPDDPVPVAVPGTMLERLDPDGEHTALYSVGTDTGRACELAVADYLGPGGTARYVRGPRFRRTQLLLKLLGVDELYSTYMDITQADFDALPPVDVKFTSPPPPEKPANGKPAGDQEGYDEEHHKGHLGRYVETVEQHTTKCCSCGVEYTLDSITVAQFLDTLYEDGWRLAASERLETKGPMCGGCYAARDQERGTADAGQQPEEGRL